MLILRVSFMSRGLYRDLLMTHLSRLNRGFILTLIILIESWKLRKIRISSSLLRLLRSEILRGLISPRIRRTYQSRLIESLIYLKRVKTENTSLRGLTLGSNRLLLRNHF